MKTKRVFFPEETATKITGSQDFEIWCENNRGYISYNSKTGEIVWVAYDGKCNGSLLPDYKKRYKLK